MAYLFYEERKVGRQISTNLSFIYAAFIQEINRVKHTLFRSDKGNSKLLTIFLNDNKMQQKLGKISLLLKMRKTLLGQIKWGIQQSTQANLSYILEETITFPSSPIDGMM